MPLPLIGKARVRILADLRAVVRRSPWRLVFLDESGAKTNMTRLRGRAPRRRRLHITPNDATGYFASYGYGIN